MPFISFIIPSFNTPSAWLEECLQSIAELLLTDDEREIVVVDDGSETPVDATLVGKYGGKLVRSEHRGVSEARNKGLELATGRYIQFVDADDRLVTEKYEKVLKLLRSEAPDAVAFTFNKQKHSSRPHHLCAGTYYVRHHNIFGAVWPYVFLKERIKNLRFCPALQYGEDEEFALKALLEMQSVRVVNISAYAYREHPASAVGKQNDQTVAQRLNDHFKLIERLDWYLYHLEGKQYKACRRRIAQLAGDYIYNIKHLSGNGDRLVQGKRQLRQLHWWPLPLKWYSTKYLLWAFYSHLKP